MALKNKTDISTAFENRNFNVEELAKTILHEKSEKELIVYALSKDQLISNRAMWVLTHCADLEPERIKPFHELLIEHLKNKKIHSEVVRSIVRIFQTQEIPENQQAFMLDKCYDYIKNPSEAIAVRAFAMTVAFNIAKSYPELLNELSVVLNHLNISEESSGIINRAKHTLKDIEMLEKKK